MKVQAYLEITMVINPENRPAAAKVYTDYRQPFLDTIEGPDKRAPYSRRGRSGYPRFRQHGACKGIPRNRFVQERCFRRAQADLGR